MEQGMEDMQAIKLKGESYGIRMVVHETAELEEIRRELYRLGTEGEHILSGAGVVVDFQEREAGLRELNLFMDYFAEAQGEQKLLSWISNHGTTLEFFRNMGLRTGIPDIRGEKGASRERKSSTLFHDRSLRSGQKIEHPGDVVLLGSLHGGGEVVAEGNVIVLGKLQGVVHAGVRGDVGARIYTGCFEAPQVRIAHKVSYVDTQASWWGEPAMIVLEDGVFVVQDVKL